MLLQEQKQRIRFRQTYMQRLLAEHLLLLDEGVILLRQSASHPWRSLLHLGHTCSRAILYRYFPYLQCGDARPHAYILSAPDRNLLHNDRLFRH